MLNIAIKNTFSPFTFQFHFIEIQKSCHGKLMQQTIKPTILRPLARDLALDTHFLTTHKPSLIINFAYLSLSASMRAVPSSIFLPPTAFVCYYLYTGWKAMWVLKVCRLGLYLYFWHCQSNSRKCFLLTLKERSLARTLDKVPSNITKISAHALLWRAFIKRYHIFEILHAFLRLIASVLNGWPRNRMHFLQ